MLKSINNSILLTLVVIITSTSLSMNLTKPVQMALVTHLTKTIEVASTYENADSNGILISCKTMLTKITADGVDSLPSVKLCNELFEKISKHEHYQEAYKQAQEKTATYAKYKKQEKDHTNESTLSTLNEQMEQAWLLFRKKAAHLCADEAEKSCSLKFNRTPEKIQEFFVANKDISQTSKEALYMQATTLVLFKIYQEYITVLGHKDCSLRIQRNNADEKKAQ